MKYIINGDDWGPDEVFDTEAEAEAFANKHRKELGSYTVEPYPCTSNRETAERIVYESMDDDRGNPYSDSQHILDAITAALDAKDAEADALLRECRQAIAQRLIGTDVDKLLSRLDARLKGRP